MKNNIRNLEEQLRDHINNPWKKYKLLQNKSKFSQLVSALDVIGDSELAIQSFQKLKSHDHGKLYLAIYGLLQSFILQQDAIFHVGLS